MIRFRWFYLAKYLHKTYILLTQHTKCLIFTLLSNLMYVRVRVTVWICVRHVYACAVRHRVRVLLLRHYVPACA